MACCPSAAAITSAIDVVNAERVTVKDVCFVYTNSDTQGRMGTHAFDLVLPPLGITYLSAILEKLEYDVEILDANALLLDDEETLARLQGRFRIVGFYCHTQNHHKIVELSTKLKNSDGDAPIIIIGGPHPTALGTAAIAGYPDIDAAVSGEGEQTIAELVPALLNRESLDGILGVIHRRDDGETVFNGVRPFVEDLDSLPMPAWHLLPMSLYRNLIETDGRRVLHVMGSRGCPADCNYCFSTKMWSSKVRWHSPGRVLAEIDHLRETYGIRFFQFLDDNFTMSLNRMRTLVPAFRERAIQWCCSTRIDLLGEEAIKLLREGRVHHVAIGIESVNDRLLKVLNKGVTREQTEETIELCERHRVPVLGMFILGIPGETEVEARESMEFALSHKFFFAVFSHMTFYPGTNFWQKHHDNPGLIRDFEHFCLSKRFTFVEPGRSQEELEALMAEANRRFYLRPRLVVRMMWLMLRNPTKWFQVGLGMMRALFGLLRPGGSKDKPALEGN